MTTNQILIGIGLILVLAVGAQVLASRLHIPAIIVLLPTGFVAGALTADVNPDKLLGPAFEPLVSLSVAVILYDAGLGLDLRKLKGHVRKVVIRLISIGVPVTWVLAASVAAPLLGMARGAAVMLGIILVVSGPTVVGPLLNFVRPTERLQRVLIWEGSLIDPVGGMTEEDDFNALASVLLADCVDGRVYRLAPPQRSHGVVAPYTGGEILFGAGMTRPRISGRYDDGARIAAQRANGALPAGRDILFLVRADGQLTPVSQTDTAVPQAGDTIVSLGPALGTE